MEWTHERKSCIVGSDREKRQVSTMEGRAAGNPGRGEDSQTGSGRGEMRQIRPGRNRSERIREKRDCQIRKERSASQNPEERSDRSGRGEAGQAGSERSVIVRSEKRRAPVRIPKRGVTDQAGKKCARPDQGEGRQSDQTGSGRGEEKSGRMSPPAEDRKESAE